MRLISKEYAGQRRVYDIEVEEDHNFYANKINVHNCTGMPVPTIAVATAGGVSVIKDSGGVVNSSETLNFIKAKFNGDTLSAVGSASAAIRYRRDIGSATAGFAFSLYAAAGSPAPTASSTAVQQLAKNASASTVGLTLWKENPASPTKGMVAYLTNAFNSGWLIGDIRGAFLADTVAETITASGELVTNGTFDTDTSGWTASGSALSVVSGVLRVTATASAAPYADYMISTVTGKTYHVSCYLATPKAGKNVFINAGSTANSGNLGFVSMGVTAGVYQFDFIATSATSHISINGVGTFVAADYFDVDNISVKLAEPDRSVKNTGLVVNGSLTKAPAATGSRLVSYSGFSAANYLEQPYSANLDFGTGDFYVMGWLKVSPASADEIIFDRLDGDGVGPRIALFVAASSSVLTLRVNDGSDKTLVSASAIDDTTWHFCVGIREGGIVKLYLDNVLLGSVGASGSLTNATAVTRLGVRGATGLLPLTHGSLALWRIGATAPSADQIAHIYRTELPLFQPGAKCTIDGTSTAVTALDYDEDTELLHVGTSWGRSTFKNLLRVESEATSVGAITSLSTSGGAILTGGTSAKIYQPALSLREELARKDEATQALGSEPVFFNYDAIAAQVAFVLPKGFTTKAVYLAGSLKRLGATKDYTTSNDGFAETVTFGVAPGAAAWVSIMAVRA